MYFIGFDIGGSSVKAVLVEDRKIIKFAVYDLPGELESLLILIEKMKEELMVNFGLDGVKGIGFVDFHDLSAEYGLRTDIWIKHENKIRISVDHLYSVAISKCILPPCFCQFF